MYNAEDPDVSKIIDKIAEVQTKNTEPITRELARYHMLVNSTAPFTRMSTEEQYAVQRMGYNLLEEIYRGALSDESWWKLYFSSLMGSGYRGVAEMIHGTILACHLLVPYVKRAFAGDAAALSDALHIVVGGYQTLIEQRLQVYSEVVHSAIDAAICGGAEKVDDFYLDYKFAPDDDNPDDVLSSLTDREMDVLRLVGLGFENGQVSSKLQISMNTTKGYVRSLLMKTGMRHRTQLALLAVTVGVVNQGEVRNALEASRVS